LYISSLSLSSKDIVKGDYQHLRWLVDQMAIGLPATAAMFFIAKSFWYNVDVLVKYPRCICCPFRYKG
jgi:hypothetical protein